MWTDKNQKKLICILSEVSSCILHGKLCLIMMNAILYKCTETALFIFIQVMHPVTLKRIGILEGVTLSKELLVVSAYKDFEEVGTCIHIVSCLNICVTSVNCRHGKSMLKRCPQLAFCFVLLDV